VRYTEFFYINDVIIVTSLVLRTVSQCSILHTTFPSQLAKC